MSPTPLVGAPESFILKRKGETEALAASASDHPVLSACQEAIVDARGPKEDVDSVRRFTARLILNDWRPSLSCSWCQAQASSKVRKIAGMSSIIRNTLFFALNKRCPA